MVEGRADLQARLRTGLRKVNAKFAHTIESRFALTVGDEFQGLLGAVDDITRILATLWRHAHPTDLRFGIGIGELETPLRSQALGMDGPCFHRARTAVERAAKEGTPVEVETGEPQAAFEIYAALFGFMRKRWTKKQRLVTDLSLSGMDGKDIAELLSIKPAAVSQHLRAAGAEYLFRASDIWLEALRRLVPEA